MFTCNQCRNWSAKRSSLSAKESRGEGEGQGNGRSRSALYRRPAFHLIGCHYQRDLAWGKLRACAGAEEPEVTPA
jgi:hypothetical protein